MSKCDSSYNCNCSSSDTSDCGDDTSTYAGENQKDKFIPEHPDSQSELDYLVCLATSSEQEDSNELSHLVNAAKSQVNSHCPLSYGVKKLLIKMLSMHSCHSKQHWTVFQQSNIHPTSPNLKPIHLLNQNQILIKNYHQKN